MRIFKVWDNVERSHYQEEFVEEAAAHSFIDDRFSAGLYPDHSCVVLEVHEYQSGRFVNRIGYSQVTADEFKAKLQHKA